jgi:hypothetical protein
MNIHFRRVSGLGFVCLAVVALLVGTGCVVYPPPYTPIKPANVTSLGSNTFQITVDARAPWVATGIIVKAGQKYKFTAQGVWGESPGVVRTADGGPAGIFGTGYWGVIPRVPGAPWGALVGRVGTARFFIGQSAVLPMPEDGELMLGINDGDDSLGDNYGFQTVTVQLVP